MASCNGNRRHIAIPEENTLTPKTVPEKTLLIHDDPVLAGMIRTTISKSDFGPLELEWVTTLSEGISYLAKEAFIAVFLALSTDSKDLAGLRKLLAAAPDIPILILGEEGGEDLAKQAVRIGARDYLLPSNINHYSLPRALHHAIEQQAVENALYVERDRALVTLNSIGDAVLCTDMSGNVTYLNVVAEDMTGWGCAEALGRPLVEVFRIVDGTTKKTAPDPTEKAVKENRTVELTMNCILVRRDGVESAIEDSAAPIHDKGGRVIGAVIVFHDVSASREMSRAMTFSAHHDILTELPNRLLLNDRINQAIALAHRDHGAIAVLYLDLDRFKTINDSLGHACGDLLLQSVSRRLLACLRSSDTVSRQGGDEFVILLPVIASSEDAAEGAERILKSLAHPHSIEGRELHINASVGICIYPEDGEDAESLLKHADMAMYDAKERGRNNFQFFNEKMGQTAIVKQATESGLLHAIERGEFVLHYQSKVSLDTEKITGVEALIRWRHSNRTLIMPDQFVSFAEDCGAIIQIGRWVMREACRQARSWQDAGLPPIPISVNVSSVEFLDKGFLNGVKTILAETGLQPRYLQLELTERVLMDNVESTMLILHELKAMGISLAVDDFGTGYSSLSYLQKFPIDVLKIDRSFVQQISDESRSHSIVELILNIGNNLDCKVVAEGIETPQQKAYLHAHHCSEGQGYLFSRPMGAEEFSKLLQPSSCMVH